MLRGAVLIHDMQTELKRNLLIGSCSFPDGHGKRNGLEIEEIGGKIIRSEILRRSLRIKIALTSGLALLDPELEIVEELVRNSPEIVMSFVFDACPPRRVEAG
jgi:hypothetical protein